MLPAQGLRVRALPWTTLSERESAQPGRAALPSTSSWRSSSRRCPAGPVAAVALGSYGRQELTPAADVELLVLHAGGLSHRPRTEAFWFPLFERKLHLEPAAQDRRRGRSRDPSVAGLLV